jgi:hypothetical protein
VSLNDFFDIIESSEFDANINILSGFNTMLRAMENDETIKKLVDKLHNSPAENRLVFQRLQELLPQNPHPEYAHPYDVALAGYLYALNQVDTNIGNQAANQVLSTPKLWWSRRLARHILQTTVPNP